MPTQVIVLNGGSSSGKSGIARCLQAILPEPWLSLSVDDLIDAMPPSLMDSGTGVTFGPQGEVEVGDAFRQVEAAWMTGLAAMARAGARIVIDIKDEDHGGRGYSCRDPEGHLWNFGTYDPWIEDTP